MKIRFAVFFLLVAASLAGWGIYAFQKLTTPELKMAEIERAFPKGSYQLFLNANKLTLYALKPETQANGSENFHNFPVAGKTEIDTVEHQKELKGAFVRGMAGAKPANCFDPRHALRAELEGKTVDIAVSFECGKFIVYSGEAQSEGGVRAENLEAPFNQILRNAGIEAAN